MIGAAHNAIDEYEQQLRAKENGIPRPSLLADLTRTTNAIWEQRRRRSPRLRQALLRRPASNTWSVAGVLPRGSSSAMQTTCFSGPSRGGHDHGLGRRCSRYLPDGQLQLGATRRRIERLFRDMAMVSNHRANFMRDFFFREIAQRLRLGIPRDLSGRDRASNGATTAPATP